MTLQNGYLVAGIVVAIVAVVTWFLKPREKPSHTSNQNAEVSGQNNSVTQNSNILMGGKTEDKLTSFFLPSNHGGHPINRRVLSPRQ